jgi:acyl carrier protein
VEGGVVTDRARVEAIASDLERVLRSNFRIPDDDALFTREVNLWEEGYVDSIGVVETIAHLERRWEVKLPEEMLFDPGFNHVSGIAALVGALVERSRPG